MSRERGEPPVGAGVPTPEGPDGLDELQAPGAPHARGEPDPRSAPHARSEPDARSKPHAGGAPDPRGEPDPRSEPDSRSEPGARHPREARRPDFDGRPTPPPPPQAPPTRRALLGQGAWAAAAAAAAAAATSLLAPARRAHAIGERSLFRFGRLALPGLPDARPSALRRLAWEVVRRTSLVTASDPDELRLADPALFRHPFLVLAGDRGFALPPEAELARLRRHLTYGGFLLIDSNEGRAGGAFDESARRLLAQLLPGELPARIAEDHVLWKSFYVMTGAPGRILAAPYVEGVERDRRLAIVYTQNDLMGALARDGYGRWEHEVIPGGDQQREEAFRFAVNLVMYALCLDYKTEQAHIDYILRTRRFVPR